MLFKNLVAWRLAPGWTMDAAGLEERLAGHRFTPCGQLDTERRGWVAPRGEEPLVRAIGGRLLVALAIEKRGVPASAIKPVLAERAIAFEQASGYAPGRKTLREMKEQVFTELLPRAFASRATVSGWIDARSGWIVADAGSTARADAFIGQLIESVGGLPVRALATRIAPATAMAGWLAADEAPAGFTIDDECELRRPDGDQPTVRYVRHALDAKEIARHIADGKLPTRLALTWADRLSFVLHDTLQLKKLDFVDVAEEREPSDAADAEELFEAEFALASGDITKLLEALTEALGGEAEAAGGAPAAPAKKAA